MSSTYGNNYLGTINSYNIISDILPVANQTVSNNNGDSTYTVGTVQDINITSNPTFAQVRLTSNPVNNYFLRCDALGNASWQAVNQHAIQDIFGTANQIIVVKNINNEATLSTPQNLDTNCNFQTASTTASNIIFSPTYQITDINGAQWRLTFGNFNLNFFKQNSTSPFAFPSVPLIWFSGGDSINSSQFYALTSNASNPKYSFQGHPNDGFYHSSSGVLGMTNNIGQAFLDNTGDFNTTEDIKIANGKSLFIHNSQYTQTDLDKITGITNGTASSNKALVVDNQRRISNIDRISSNEASIANFISGTDFNQNSIFAVSQLSLENGTVSNPSLYFYNNDCGIFTSANRHINFTCNSIDRFEIAHSGNTSKQSLSISSGSLNTNSLDTFSGSIISCNSKALHGLDNIRARQYGLNQSNDRSRIFEAGGNYYFDFENIFHFRNIDPTNGNVLRIPFAILANGTTVADSININDNNFILWNAANAFPPTTTTRSLGTRIVLFPAISSTTVDYALGIDGSTQWFSVPSINNIFKFYCGTNEIVRINSSGISFNYINPCLSYGTSGVAPPTVSTRSSGMKILLYDQINANDCGYGIGIDGATVWYCTANVGTFHKFYIGTTVRTQISDSGLNTNSITTLSGNDIDFNGKNLTNVGSMIVSQIIFGNGSVSSPAISFITNEGFYRIAKDVLGLTLNGVERVRWNTGKMISSVNIDAPNLDLTGTLTVAGLSTFNGQSQFNANSVFQQGTTIFNTVNTYNDLNNFWDILRIQTTGTLNINGTLTSGTSANLSLSNLLTINNTTTAGNLLLNNTHATGNTNIRLLYGRLDNLTQTPYLQLARTSSVSDLEMGVAGFNGSLVSDSLQGDTVIRSNGGRVIFACGNRNVAEVRINNSNIGIPLWVDTGFGVNVNNFGYLNNGGAVGYYAGVPQNWAVSLYTGQAIVCNAQIMVISDKRTKSEIKDIEEKVIEDFLKIDTKEFKKDGQTKPQFGYMAQDLAKVSPNFVNLFGRDGVAEEIDTDGFVSPANALFSVNYECIDAIQHMIIKKQQERIKTLEIQLNNVMEILSRNNIN